MGGVEGEGRDLAMVGCCCIAEMRRGERLGDEFGGDGEESERYSLTRQIEALGKQ